LRPESQMNMQTAQPSAEHRWLQRMIGEWTVAGEYQFASDQPAAHSAGHEIVRTLGGLWIIAEGKGSIPDGGCDSVITLGFDPHKKIFVGTFIGSTMTHLWPYQGQLSEDGQRLVLESEGPSFSGDGMACFRDIIEFVNDDHRRMHSLVLNSDGQWHQFMTTQYHRM
ncbi:MAG: DUF1579 domain-containing protein, partial [Planctomycetaceae bacterium]